MQLVVGQKLYGALINYKLFDYELDFGGAESPTTWPPAGPTTWSSACWCAEDADRHRTARRRRALPGRRAGEHAQRIARMLDSWLAQPEQAVGQLSLMSADEQAAVTSGRPGRR